MKRENKFKKTDFDYRVSQLLSLPYKDYTNHEGNSLELLSWLKDKRSYSIEWCNNEKRFSLIIYSSDGLYGQMFKGETISRVVKEYFSTLIFKKQ